MDRDSTKRIPVFIERLLKQYLPVDDANRLKSYFLRLLSVRLSTPPVQENTLKESILQKLSPTEAEKFKELYFKLIKLKAISKRTQILYLLSRIKSDPITSLFTRGPSDQNTKITKPVTELVQNKHIGMITILEPDLITDILSILNNKPGKYLKFHEIEDKYKLEKANTLVQYTQTTDKILELAWLHLKVLKYISTDHISQTRNLLSHFLELELNDYNTLLHKISEDKPLSLRKIDYWCFDAINRMKLLSMIIDSIEDLKGSQVISSIFLLSHTGNPATQTIMLKALDTTSAALIQMIASWVMQGYLNDPYQEFFIAENLLFEDDLWGKKYYIVHDMVPSFFNHELIKKIMLVGKSINFIRTSCKEVWVSQENTDYPKIYDLENINLWVDKVSEKTNNYLLQLINFKYNLETHFSLIKKVLLLYQGDFHHYLMQQLVQVLCENSQKLFKHDLLVVLENGIRYSGLKYEGFEFLSRIDVKLLEPSPLDTGWDIFTLEYIFSPPLTTIFTAKAMETYLRAFKFLWQIKRAQYLLNGYQCGRDMIVYQTYYEIEQVFHAFQILRHEVSHFINNLMSYMILEVVETSWKEFEYKISKTQDLDQLISVHQAFLAQLTQKAFLDDESIYRSILKIVDICVRLHNTQQELFKAAQEERNRREQFIRIGTLDELKVFDEYLCDLNLIKQEFYEEFTQFNQKLTMHNMIHLKFLAFRLDFNEYYELKSLVE